MTGSDDSNSATRPISVAELLAKNGTIGAPPVGGRRRRRRGNADAVTVAELTGEIPVIRTTDDEPATTSTAVEEQVDDRTEAPVAPAAPEAPSGNGAVDHVEPEAAEPEPEPEPDVVEDEDVDQTEDADQTEEADDDVDDDVDDDYADVVAEYSAHLEHREADPEPVDAEQMNPDPLDDGVQTDLLDSPADLESGTAELDDTDLEDATLDDAALDTDDGLDTDDELPSYLRSTQEPLFGGQTVADDIARRGTRPIAGDTDLDEMAELDDDQDEEYDEPRRMSPFVHGLWIVGQSVVAVVFGAGLFVAFDQLWKWNNIVALVLSVLVILGLVVGVRVVRKTEDIGSTLIAVAVGALVTLGPLALLQSG